MRLTSIKLSGFKSFVDPTNFQVPGQLVGVVGPNGCGKSNIIDAVRWVLGESRASELRGESMQDVIFNGTTHRKPAGRSSVELAFDNSEGKAAGQWQQYAEISVKRTLTRDGTSTYYINNLAVRRRDIQDIFMGTGLGPRAYAIIGQGMISRIIEARPEELRIFLEEAAGVSKYKQRRLETENRLNDTRENLIRVDDIVRELRSNLTKLQSQAEVAKRFNALQVDQNEMQTLLWLLRKNEAGSEQAKFFAQVDHAQTALEASTASLRNVEAALESLRQSHFVAGEHVQLAQGQLYQTNADIGSLETQIRFVAEARTRLLAQLHALAAQHDHWQGQRELHQQQLGEAEILSQELSMRVAETAETAQLQQELLPGLEQVWRDGQRASADARTNITQIRAQRDLASTRQQNAAQILAALVVRRTRLVQESDSLQRPDQSHLQQLQTQSLEKQARLEALQQSLEAAQQAQAHLQQCCQDTKAVALAESATHAHLDARLSALAQLQATVQTQETLQPWLAKHGLLDLPRLWQRLSVAPGWESALEAVLRERTGALQLPKVENVTALLEDCPPSKLTLIVADGIHTAVPKPTPNPMSMPMSPPQGLRPFIDLVKAIDAGIQPLLQEWLREIYVIQEGADISHLDLLQVRASLPPGACLVTPAGHLIGHTSLRFYALDTPQEGMLARQAEIDHLHKQLRVQKMLAQEAQERSAQADEGLRQNLEQQQQTRGDITSATQIAHALQLDILKISDRNNRFEERQVQISGELSEIHAQESEQGQARAEHEARYEELDASLVELTEDAAAVQADFQEKELRFNEAQRRLRGFEQLAQEASFTEKSHHSRLAELQRSLVMAGEQVAQVSTSLKQANEEMASLQDDLIQADLQKLLDRRIDQEKTLSDVRHALDQQAQQLRQHDDARLQAERSLQPQREQIMGLQLKEQAARLSEEQYRQQLAEANIDQAALATKLTPAMQASQLQTELSRLTNAIAGLGAVNLAALDELEQACERNNFLEAQIADLTTAINTLQDAIYKIDHETRDLLKDTFDKVNRHFGELFPMLFGGGNARLIMTGDEILDAGVQVMAQPPGKKNATIHLLSGGEKALTATALVFSMFQLNPAPFCLLDEVDAPLDDANTERFCNMVRKMSQNTQFLFISHNKIAMEMAHQLIGVTMQEQGVSRIVAVELEAARHFVADPAAA